MTAFRPLGLPISVTRTFIVGGSTGTGASIVTDEARLALCLSHPNIVTVYDYGEDGETPFLVLELIDGASLGEAVRSRVLGWEEAAQIARYSEDCSLLGVTSLKQLDKSYIARSWPTNLTGVHSAFPLLNLQDEGY